MSARRAIPKVLLGLVGLVVGLYLLSLILIPFLIEPDPIESRVPPETDLELLSEAVGWYEIEPGACVLLTYAADGNLAFVSTDEDLFLQRFELIEPDRFVWSPGREQRGRDVR